MIIRCKSIVARPQWPGAWTVEFEVELGAQVPTLTTAGMTVITEDPEQFVPGRVYEMSIAGKEQR